MGKLDAGVLSRAQGCLMGQLAGDALGSVVEFLAPEEIRIRYPGGVAEMGPSPVWSTLAGQPTDDSEMALALAASILSDGGYNPERAKAAYLDWLDSSPFDCGATVRAGLRGAPNASSQANGALMRASPLGVFGWRFDAEQVALWARQDAAITHPHPACQDANAVFCAAIAHAVRSGCSRADLYAWVLDFTERSIASEDVKRAVRGARHGLPADFVTKAGWVLVALQNAFSELLHADSLESALVATVGRGGDADTNGAICGALLGAAMGLEAVPERWKRCVLDCRPREGDAGVLRPRPERFWPTSALNLAELLLTACP